MPHLALSIHHILLIHFSVSCFSWNAFWRHPQDLPRLVASSHRFYVQVERATMLVGSLNGKRERFFPVFLNCYTSWAALHPGLWLRLVEEMAGSLHLLYGDFFKCQYQSFKKVFSKGLTPKPEFYIRQNVSWHHVNLIRTFSHSINSNNDSFYVFHDELFLK